MRRYVAILLCMLLLVCAGCEKSETDIAVEEPVIMGMGYFDNYVLMLRLYNGEYEGNFSPGPDFGPNWVGEYELVIAESGSSTVLSRYPLTEWEEPLRFQESFELQLTDLNGDGCLEISGDHLVYSIYDNAKGEMRTGEIELAALDLLP